MSDVPSPNDHSTEATPDQASRAVSENTSGAVGAAESGTSSEVTTGPAASNPVACSAVPKANQDA